MWQCEVCTDIISSSGQNMGIGKERLHKFVKYSIPNNSVHLEVGNIRYFQ